MDPTVKKDACSQVTAFTKTLSEMESNAGFASTRSTVEHTDRFVGWRHVNPVFKLLEDFDPRPGLEMMLQPLDRRLAVGCRMRKCLQDRIVHCMTIR